MSARKAYSDAEHRAIAAAYVRLAVAQYNGDKLSKAAICRGLIAITGRTRGAIEAKFMNLSGAAVAGGQLQALPGGYVRGYKPAAHGAKCLGDWLDAEMARNVAAHPLIVARVDQALAAG